ncbi:MAG: ABC transporter ATP-binding protein [Bacilli bacterium]
MKYSFKSLMLLLKKYPWTILIEIINIFLGIILVIIPIRIVGQIVTIYEDNKDMTEMITAVIIFSIVFIAVNVATFITNYFRTYIERNFKVHLSILFYKKLDEIDYDFHESPKFLNDYTRALESGTTRIYDSANGLISIVKLVFQSLSIFAIIFSMHYLAVLYAVGVGLIYALLRFRIGVLDFQALSKQRPYFRQRNYVNRTFFIKDSMADLKTSQIEDILLENNEIANDAIVDIIDKVIVKKTWLSYFGDILITSIYPVTLAVLAYATIDNISLSDFSSLTIAATTLSTIVTGFVTSIGSLQNSAIECKIPFEVLSMKSKIEGEEFKPFDEEFSTLELKNVSFAYDGVNNVLNNINMSIKKGEKIAIVGTNGAGKTTLVKLLLRLYDATEGDILINNENYRELNAVSLRKQVGAVFQNVEVYAATIAENIIFRKPSSEEDFKIIDQALEFSGLKDFVMNLKDGINTLVTREFNVDGVIFSGGQKQRIAIARGYAQNYNLLILDEPSSALDPLSEAQIYHNMLEIGKNKTIVFISHRLTTTVNADKIFLFENGEIIESGNHIELMTLNGIYKKMFTSQASKYLGGNYEDV